MYFVIYNILFFKLLISWIFKYIYFYYIQFLHEISQKKIMLSFLPDSMILYC